MTHLLIKIYNLLLGLYPTSFRDEFCEQMLLDFSDMVIDASEKGMLSLVLFCLHELMELPINLLQMHWKEKYMAKLLRSQPLNFGIRGAIGFGVVYTLTFPLVKFIHAKLSFIDSIVANLQVSYYDRYHVERSFELISQIPYILSLLISGLLLGGLFAILFAGRAQHIRYMWIGLLGWMMQNLISQSIMSFNFWVFLTETQHTYFSYMMFVLTGAVWGLIFAIVQSERQDAVHWLAGCVIAFPLFTYLWVKWLFALFVFRTPWRFVGVIVMFVLLIIGIFMLSRKLDVRRKFPWVVLAGVAGYLLIVPLAYLIGSVIFPSMFSVNTALDSLSITVSSSIHGGLLGLFLGLVVGFQRRDSTQQAMA